MLCLCPCLPANQTQTLAVALSFALYTVFFVCFYCASLSLSKSKVLLDGIGFSKLRGSNLSLLVNNNNNIHSIVCQFVGWSHK